MSSQDVRFANKLTYDQEEDYYTRLKYHVYYLQSLIRQYEQKQQATIQKQMIVTRLQPKLCKVCCIKHVKQNRKYCGDCAKSRSVCANLNCKELCGFDFVFCYHCNIICDECQKLVSRKNTTCSNCIQSIENFASKQIQ